MGSGRSHVHSEIYLHVNWHCRYDKPMIRPEIEAPLHAFLQQYCAKVKGIHFKGSGGTEDHVHLAFQMEPFAPLSDFLGQIKGASAHEMNQAFGPGAIRWQRGYGIVSFSTKYLPAVLRYVANQKEHHRLGTINPTLEEHGEEGDEEPGEDSEQENG
ncbi:MAG: IS200/IS605 family transposase [Candidatus Sumerlaeota bacterium]|nr:IS200/IS605 family transposase [Candidatus Sumerlaeota bacterium]